MSPVFDDDMFPEDDFDTDDDRGEEQSGSGEAGAPAPDPEFSSVYEFVEDHLVVLYARKMAFKQDRLWCPRWFEHAEAVSRLEALWRAYEQLRLEPGTGMSVWWRDHADHHMRALFDTAGPFEGCSVDLGHAGPVDPLPTDYMDDTALRRAMSTTPDTTSAEEAADEDTHEGAA